MKPAGPELRLAGCLAGELQAFPDEEVDVVMERMRRCINGRESKNFDKDREVRSEELVGI